MTPVLNQMNVVGIVSIPGMMTGQILAGADPSQVRSTVPPLSLGLGACNLLRPRN